MGCATSLVKYIVFIFNFLFLLAGLAFIVVGVIIKLDLDDFSLNDIDIPLVVAPILMIVVGCIVFVIAFFGCCGAIKENTCLLTTYAVILLIILIAQIAVGVYAFIQTKDSNFSEQDMVKAFNKLQNAYVDDPVVKDAVNLIQIELKCCGALKPEDWTITPLPPSCCGKSEGDCITATNTMGCAQPLFDFVKSSIKIIGIVILSIAAVELVGAIIALCLSSSIKNNARRGHYA